LTLKEVVLFDMNGGVFENETRMVTAAAWWKGFTEDARYLVLLLVRWIVHDRVDARMGHLFPRGKHIADLCHVSEPNY
jgi:hypothetical protein